MWGTARERDQEVSSGGSVVCSAARDHGTGLCGLPTGLREEELLKAEKGLCSKPAAQAYPAAPRMVFRMLLITPMSLLPLAKHHFEHFPQINVFNPHTSTMGWVLPSLSFYR